MNIVLLNETNANERRVALTPDVIRGLAKWNITALVEHDAGKAAGFSDEEYQDARGTIINNRPELLAQADLLAVLHPLSSESIAQLRTGSCVVGFLNPFGDTAPFKQLSEKKVSALSLELIPRITRAQAMDALSSQATVAGYKAVLLAAATSGIFFPMLTTAAGTIRPAKVLVIGAGVAGLMAIATARKLGAVVEGYDIRPEVKEQIQSLGAKSVAADALNHHIAQSNIIITTAQLLGKRAPLIVTAEMVRTMKPGSIIVDLAAEQGGNCAVTVAGKEIVEAGVIVLGPINLPATVPYHASSMFARNIAAVIGLIVKDGKLVLDQNDDIIRSILWKTS